MEKRRSTHPVDIHVGNQLRVFRQLQGLSQTDLGDAVGLTFQQIQKYERGANRISASRLYEFSRLLNKPVALFFEGLEETKSASSADDPLHRKETLQLVRYYYQMPGDLRDATRALVSTLADA